MALVTQRFDSTTVTSRPGESQVCELMLDADTDWTDGTVLGIHLASTGLKGGVVHLDCAPVTPACFARTTERVARTPARRSWASATSPPARPQSTPAPGTTSFAPASSVSSLRASRSPSASRAATTKNFSTSLAGRARARSLVPDDVTAHA